MLKYGFLTLRYGISSLEVRPASPKLGKGVGMARESTVEDAIRKKNMLLNHIVAKILTLKYFFTT
jgi:hypothetical protein